MRRSNRINQDWATPDHLLWEHVAIEVLMDIRQERQELQKLNHLLHCSNFLAIPRRLQAIDKNTRHRVARQVPDLFLGAKRYVKPKKVAL